MRVLLFINIFMKERITYTSRVFIKLNSEKESKQKEENLQPSISLEDKSNDTVLLKVVYGKNISKLEYRWNDEEEQIVKADSENPKEIKFNIEIPKGTNDLTIIAVDKNNNSTKSWQNIIFLFQIDRYFTKKQ